MQLSHSFANHLSFSLIDAALRFLSYLTFPTVPQWKCADVIEWMLENLIDKTRTRRGVMKKLKELGLQFTKPSRRREKQNPNWSEELDEELKALYAQYGETETPMAHIMSELSDSTKSQRMVVNRLAFLGCISGKAQLAPPKKRSSKKKKRTEDEEHGEADNDDNDEDELEFAQRPDGTSFLKPKKQAKANKAKRTRKAAKKSFNVATAQGLIQRLSDEGMADALEWFREALEDVAEDLQDEDVDQDDAIPLVPITGDQREAVENAEFKALLREFGMQEPLAEMVSRVDIPVWVDGLRCAPSVDGWLG